jgi:hypothetical protein
MELIPHIRSLISRCLPDVRFVDFSPRLAAVAVFHAYHIPVAKTRGVRHRVFKGVVKQLQAACLEGSHP